MQPSTLSIKTENIDLPPGTPTHTIETDRGLKIEVTSICIGHASRLASDFSLALEHGAYPGMHALIIEEVRAAEEKGVPLACVLSFGA